MSLPDERRPLLVARGWVQAAGLEAGRFHRALALTLIVLAALMALAALVRHHDPAEAAALGGVLALSVVLGSHFAPVLRTD